MKDFISVSPTVKVSSGGPTSSSDRERQQCNYHPSHTAGSSPAKMLIIPTTEPEVHRYGKDYVIYLNISDLRNSSFTKVAIRNEK